LALLRIRRGFIVPAGGEFEGRMERRGNCIAFPYPMAFKELLNVLILVGLDRSVVLILDLDAKKLLGKFLGSSSRISRRLGV
jgi:hypothetical protein